MAVRKRNIQILACLACALYWSVATANGNANGNGNANSSSNGSANGSTNGNANGSANGTSNGNANGNANGTSNGNSNGEANGTSNGNANGDNNGASYSAHIYQRGQRLWFVRLPDQAITSSAAIYLKLSFDGVQQFDAAALRLAINGELAEVSSWRDHSTWSVENGQPVLLVRLSDASFWDHRTLWERIAAIQHRHGHLRIWVNAPATVHHAEIVCPVAVPRPRIVIDSRQPAEGIFTATQFKVAFHADAPADHFECSLDRQRYQICQSPVTYSNLNEGLHHFRARAIASNAKAGPHASLWFTVVPPAIEFVSIDPTANPTSRSDIKVAFRILSDVVGTSVAQCRVDNNAYQPCTSPVAFTRLGPGDHRLDVQRVTNFFFLSWTWYPTSYFWTINTAPAPPVIHFTANPPVATNSTSAAFSFAANEDNVTFQCALDNGAVQSCRSPWNLTSLTEGAHQVQITGFDSAQQASAPITFSWVIDRTPPSIQVSVSPAQNPTSSRQLDVSYTTSEPATVTCTLDGQPLSSCPSPFSLTSLTEGAHHLTIVPTDAVGNVGVGWAYDWTVDLTAPTVSIGLVSPASLPTNQTTAQFTLTASESAALACTLDGQATACGAQLMVSDLAEGTHTLVAIATDTAGNTSQPATFQWTVDLTAPVLAITDVQPPESPTARSDVQISFTTSEAAGVSCNRDHSGAAPCTSPFVANGLADGAHSVDFIATDAAGNVSKTVTYAWTVSSIASASLDNVEPGNSPTNSRTIAFSFSSPQSSQFVCSLDGVAATACSSPQTYGALAEGSHNFAVQALNALGAAGPAATYQWLVDITPPVLTVTYTPSQSVTATNTMRADFTTNEAASVTCQLDGAAASSCQTPYLSGTLADGAHTLTLVATDTAGNSTTQTRTWTLSTVATVAIGQVSPTGSLVNSRNISIAFSSTNSSQFVCSLDNATPAACTSPYTNRALADGAHHFTVQALNLNGQAGTAAAYDWTIDATAPVLTLGTAVPSANPTASNSLQLPFSTNEHATVTCSLDGATAVPCPSPYTASGLADGNHKVVLQATDDAGNQASASYSWKIISVATVALGAISPAGALVRSHSISIAFSSPNSSQFVCSLDGAAASACTAPYLNSAIADGAHRFTVSALNPASQPGPAAAYSWMVDTTPPALTLTATPAENPTGATTISLAISSNESATFTCALDGGAIASCVSPYQASGLGDGNHQIVVTATDIAGNQSAATYQWSIISVATVTLGTPTPSASLTNSRTISFPFTSPNSSQFVCSLDGAAAAACTSPQSYSGLADGSHTFAVQALNPDGQAGPAASYGWQVDATPPVVTLGSESPSWSPTATQTLTVTFSSDSSSTFNCTVDSLSAVACSSPWSTAALTDGSHSIAIVATDGAGNASQPATYTWTIDTTPLTIANASADAATQTSTTIRWQTNVGATSQLFYNTGTNPTTFPFSTTLDGSYVTTHAVPLTLLKSNTVYSVFARSVDRDGRTTDSPVVTFRTQR